MTNENSYMQSLSVFIVMKYIKKYDFTLDFVLSLALSLPLLKNVLICILFILSIYPCIPLLYYLRLSYKIEMIVLLGVQSHLYNIITAKYYIFAITNIYMSGILDPGKDRCQQHFMVKCTWSPGGMSLFVLFW